MGVENDEEFFVKPPEGSRSEVDLPQRWADGFEPDELVADNYFHAVLEASKSVSEKVRKLTGLDRDGAQLFEEALGGATPLLRINSFSTETERGEQRGFSNLLVGMFGVFRNPTAHVPRAAWPMTEQDALDLLVLASNAHRRLDKAS